MVSVLTSSAVDCTFEPRSGQTKDFKIGICCFSAKHVALRRKSKNWLARNQDFIEDQSNAVLYDSSQPTAGTVVAGPDYKNYQVWFSSSYEVSGKLE
jgi:hypothetical protein